MLVTLPSPFASALGRPTIFTRARAWRRRAMSRRGSPGRLTPEPYSSPEELYPHSLACRELAFARGHPGERVGPEHRGEDVRALLLRGLRVPRVVPRGE